LPFILLSEFRTQGFSLLVNATPVGGQNESPPFAVDSLNHGVTVIDLAYGTQSTFLASRTLSMGGAVIDGHDVLLAQVRKQFKLMTGQAFPPSVDREILGHAVSPYDHCAPQPVPTKRYTGSMQQ